MNALVVALALPLICSAAYPAEAPSGMELQVVRAKTPSSEVRFVGTYWDAYGKKHDIERTVCWYCGQVISEIHHGCEGQKNSGYLRQAHVCPFHGGEH